MVMDSSQKIKMIGTNVPVQKNEEGGGTDIVQQQTLMILM